MNFSLNSASISSNPHWPYSAWVISDGTMGMLSQSLALIRAMDIDADDIRAIPTPLLRSFPRLAKIPGWQLTLGREPDWLKRRIYPDLLVTTGRRMAGISIGIRRRSAGKTKTIHIQDPRIPADLFDLLIVPRHDPLAQAPAQNILVSTGSLNRIRKIDIEQAAGQCPDPSLPQGRFIACMIGGNSKSGPISAPLLERRILQICRLARAVSTDILIIPSRRTGTALCTQIEQMFARHAGDIGVTLWQKNSPNPYLYALGKAEMIVVTADSVNMTTEACITGKPVLTASIGPISSRITQFHQYMEQASHTQSLDSIDERREKLQFAPTPLDEMDDIATQVFNRLAPA